MGGDVWECVENVRPGWTEITQKLGSRDEREFVPLVRFCQH